ncbi:MAG: hypothetical protein ACYDCP_07155 [Thermoplasmataceae archaeon]
MPFDPEVLAKLKAAHGEVFTTRLSGTDIAFRLPTTEEYAAYVDAVGPGSASGPIALLVSACALLPDAKTLGDLCRRKPGVVEVLSKLIRRECGASAVLKAVPSPAGFVVALPGGGEIVFKEPSIEVQNRLLDTLEKGTTFEPVRKYVEACIVDGADLLQARPGLIESLSALIRDASGASEVAEAKKV